MKKELKYTSRWSPGLGTLLLIRVLSLVVAELTWNMIDPLFLTGLDVVLVLGRFHKYTLTRLMIINSGESGPLFVIGSQRSAVHL